MIGPQHQDVADTSHHMWHEVIDIFGPKLGILLVIAAVLTGIWLWRRKR